ncbi:MAG: hypothetical protein DMF61_00160 [Blastocatellia bacterium AA13]|nr:MAG: hypothetical protein DMF61_00160 [Blastocatellia bacterium AA13]
MFKRSILRLLIGALCVLLAGFAFAGGPAFWEISKQEDVARGDAQGISIADNGAMVLAPAFELVYDTKEAFVWSSTVDASGNIYLGTGHEGRIYKIGKDGAGRLLYDSPELDVTALTTDPQGNIYAGTSPDGKIYKISPDGKTEVFYDPADKYIWSLAFDSSKSLLYAGTGGKGIVYRIDREGKGAVLSDTNETNIVSLAVEKNGDILAGSDPSGLVFRISPSGKTFALFDSPTQEIHSLTTLPDGSIYALGINAQAGSSRQNSVGLSSSTRISSDGVITLSSDDQEGSTPSVTVQSTDLSAMLGQGKTQGRSSADGAKSALFHIFPDGGSEVVWNSRDTVGFGLRALPDGRVLVGTGSKGRIYSIAKNRSPTLLVQSPEDQTSTILAVGEELYATSSNAGKLYRLSNKPVESGTYTSPVRDAKFNAQWGTIAWRGSGTELQTRSGNTESPDATWSDWSPSYRAASGEQITSPRARFLQWRAILRNSSGGNKRTTTGNAILQSVVIAYLPRNQQPEVGSITIMPPGVAMAEQPVPVDPSISSSGLDPQLFGVALTVPPRRFYQKGARTLVWQASDPNDDPLVFKLFYRPLGDNEWHLLADNLTQAYYTIDANKIPDGSYQFKVLASDAPGNPESLALIHENVTDIVEIDNTPPVISAARPVVKGLTAEIDFDTSDTTSRIVKGEFSIDGGAWLLVFPIDGIADSQKETFKIKAVFQTAGEHVVAFRCSDSSGNVAASKITVKAAGGQ